MNEVTVGLCIDASQSMADLVDDVKQGYTEYIEGLRRIEQQGEVRTKVATLVFRGRGDRRPDGPYSLDRISDELSYYTSGQTPMLDAIGDMIALLDKSVGRGDGACVVVQTDGQENNSSRYAFSDVKRLVRSREDQGWKFLFIGVGMTQEGSEAVAESIGFRNGTVLSVSRSATRASFEAIQQYTAAASR